MLFHRTREIPQALGATSHNRGAQARVGGDTLERFVENASDRPQRRSHLLPSTSGQGRVLQRREDVSQAEIGGDCGA
jgi:hypothetical protein